MRRLGRAVVHVFAAVLALQVPVASIAQTTSTSSSGQQAAGDDGTAFGKAAKAEAAQIPDQEVNAGTMPGYQAAPEGLSGLMGSSDSNLVGASGAATNSEAWQLMRSADTNRARVDPSSLQDIYDRAETINEEASASTTGGGIGATQGQCQEIAKDPTQVYYDATCDVGEKLTASQPVMHYECPPGWSLTGTTCTTTKTQAAHTDYSCPSGGALDGTNCVTSTPATASYSCPEGSTLEGTSCLSTQPATVAEYTCPSGFSLSGTNCTQTLSQPAAVSGYSCPADQTVQGSTCVRTLQQSATPVYSCPADAVLTGTTCASGATYQATVGYSCPSGFVLSGTTCTQNISQPATGNVVCPSGYILNNGVCAMVTSYTAVATTTCPPSWIVQANQCSQNFAYAAGVVYTCPPYFHEEGTSCWTNRYQCGVAGSTTLYRIINGGEMCAHRKAEISGGCSNPKFTGQTKIGSETYCLYKPAANYQCPKSSTDAPNAMCPNASDYAVGRTANYNCPNGGTLSGTTCSGTNFIGTTIQYSCPDGGTVSGTQCIVQQETNPATEYSCPSGYSLSGSTCSISASQGATGTYTCPNGGALTGTTCSTESSTPAEVSYNCPAGWSLAGDQCTSTSSQAAEPIYTCPVGYDVAGSMCSRTDVQPATAQYSCPTDWSLSGTTCSSTTSAATSYSCPSGTTLSGSTCSASAPATATYRCPTDFVLTDTTCTNTLTQSANGTLVCQDAAATMSDGTCYTPNGQSDCDSLAANPQCSFERDTCLDEEPNGPCTVLEKTYKCPVPGDQGPPNKEYVCGGDLYCVDGSCQQVERDSSNELKDALVALGAIDQAHKEFDVDKLDMFKGTRETCHKPIFGLVNCCAGKVSGLLTGGSAALAWTALGSGGVTAIAGIATQFLTTFLCSNDEKQLDVKDRLGLCHFVGSYCSSSFLGVCQTKQKAYCCFESKLSRILQEQGRPQIGKPWDKPKTESCKGFTIDEFSKLDLSQMDFTEIYSEFLEAAKLPDEAQMATDIQAKIKAYYQQNGLN